MKLRSRNSIPIAISLITFLFEHSWSQYDGGDGGVSTTLPPSPPPPPLYFMTETDEGPKPIYDGNHEYLRYGVFPSLHTEELVMDVYGLPGMHQELKVELAAGSFECFHQRLQKDAKFSLFFEVLKGADKNIDFEIIQPDGMSLQNFQWTNEGQVNTRVPMDGVYTVCMDNRLSRYSNKIVFLFMNSYFEADWEKLSKDIQDLYDGVANVTHYFSILDENVKKMMGYKSQNVHQILKDWYLISDNNKHVQRMSIILCAVIVLTSVLQVIFVRKLFTVPKTTPTSKPRA